MNTTTITIGGKRPDLNGINVSSYAKDILKNTKYQKKVETIDLVYVKVSEMDIEEYPTTEQIFAWAKEKGYALCPAEVGPCLVSSIEDREWLTIGMEPIPSSDGNPNVFYVSRDGDGRWLYAYIAEPQDRWNGDSRFAFRKIGTENSEPQPSEDLGSLTLDQAIALCKENGLVVYKPL